MLHPEMRRSGPFWAAPGGIGSARKLRHASFGVSRDHGAKWPPPPSGNASVLAVSPNIVKRAKVVDMFTAMEYDEAIQVYLSCLSACRSRLPHHAMDAVRDVLSFALSFTKAAQEKKYSREIFIAAHNLLRFPSRHPKNVDSRVRTCA